ncbi:hypothetical protein ACFL5U_03840 [Candidatus Margulisiibacteriota bacterium]
MKKGSNFVNCINNITFNNMFIVKKYGDRKNDKKNLFKSIKSTAYALFIIISLLGNVFLQNVFANYLFPIVHKVANNISHQRIPVNRNESKNPSMVNEQLFDFSNEEIAQNSKTIETFPVYKDSEIVNYPGIESDITAVGYHDINFYNDELANFHSEIPTHLIRIRIANENNKEEHLTTTSTFEPISIPNSCLVPNQVLLMFE